MTPEKQRIAIAEACGWKHVGRSLAGLGGFPPDGHKVLPSPEAHEEDWRIRLGKPLGKQWFGLPDYPNDLNAMHEAVACMSPEQRSEYVEMLVLLFHKSLPKFGGVFELTPQRLLLISEATAAQRAEAFLRTRGQWEDDNEA